MRLHHLALFAADVDGLAGFYRDLLGLAESHRAVDERGLRAVWLDLGGAILMVERAPDGAAPGGRGLGVDGLYFAIPAGEGAAWSARLEAAGAPVERRTTATLYARDPEGNRFGVSCWPGVLDPGE